LPALRGVLVHFRYDSADRDAPWSVPDCSSEGSPNGWRVRTFACIAWLPDFGDANGIYVLAKPVNEDLWHVTSLTGHQCSFIDISSYNKFDRQRFIETLLGWGLVDRLRSDRIGHHVSPNGRTSTSNDQADGFW
jgi:hypothetical protein